MVHTSQVAQGSTHDQSKHRASDLHSTLTCVNFSFLLVFLPSFFSPAIKSLSKCLQYDSVSVDRVARKLSATKERLETRSATAASTISADTEAVGSDLIYL